MVTASRWPASTARSVSATAGTRRDPFSDLRRTNGMRFLAGCETENSTVSGGIDRASGRAMDACGLWPADRGVAEGLGELAKPLRFSVTGPSLLRFVTLSAGVIPGRR